MITPGGRGLGRRQDSDDGRDRRFLETHPEAATSQLPPSVDLRSRLPACFDQGRSGSCGPNMGDGLMCFLFPEMASRGFSRLQIYRDVRVIEGTGDQDAGVETRDVFKTLQKTGAAPENLWPFDLSRLAAAPPASVYAEARKYRLGSYSRLVSGSNYLQCLASGSPFGLGFNVPESLDSDEVNRTGIMTVPGGRIIGGHDVLVVGYVLNFRSDPIFRRSGVDPALVSDEMLIVRNSWGVGWSHMFRGHFFMPLQYAMDTTNGNDAWTGRR